jgi:hypothetical protein
MGVTIACKMSEFGIFLHYPTDDRVLRLCDHCNKIFMKFLTCESSDIARKLEPFKVNEIVNYCSEIYKEN